MTGAPKPGDTLLLFAAGAGPGKPRVQWHFRGWEDTGTNDDRGRQVYTRTADGTDADTFFGFEIQTVKVPTKYDRRRTVRSAGVEATPKVSR